MTLTYFKRLRMEIRLSEDLFRKRSLPPRFRFLPFSPSLIRDHGIVKWKCFRGEIDSTIFPCLAERAGCIQLMKDIARRNDFVPEATWLLAYDAEYGSNVTMVGTVQGLRTSAFEGGVQNLGIIPEFRHQGLGTLLLFKALQGFYAAGCQVAHLEVTFQNSAAVRLYERLGFRRTETVFKVADVTLSQV